MGISWKQLVGQECFDVALNLGERARKERKKGLHICPPQNDIFRAFALTQPEDVKVVIIGQDPYHDPNIANGLAFSVAADAKIPPSLRNIFKELMSDIQCPIPEKGDLTAWAKQGVLLINSILTVYEHEPLSHAGWGWQKFTKEVVSKTAELPQPIVYILWGAFAQDFKKNIIKSSYTQQPEGIILQNDIKKGIIMSSYPSPFSVSKPFRDTPAFWGSRPFSKANEILTNWGSTPIKWSI